MKKFSFSGRFQPTRDMKKAIHRNAQHEEQLSTVVRQLDKEKQAAFIQLSEKREAFVRERLKRRLSLPVIEKMHQKHTSVDYTRPKAYSVDEGKDVSLSFYCPGKFVAFANSSQNLNNNQEQKYTNASVLGVETKSLSGFSEDTTFTNQNNDACRLPGLKGTKENENLQTQRRSFKLRSLSITEAPSFNDKRTQERRLTLPRL